MPLKMTRWGQFLIFLGILGCSRAKPPENEPETAPVIAAVIVAPEVAYFKDETTDSGVVFSYQNGEKSADHYSILESLGGGAGVLDFDGDGLLDLFLPGGGGFAGADKKTIVGYPCALFRNLGANKFQEVTAAAGLQSLAGGKPWFYSHGVAVADYDRDGWPDLLVTGWGGVALFRNVPVDPAHPGAGRRYEDATGKAGLSQGITWATSAAFADLDGDGYPDLYLCQYVDWSWLKHPLCHYDGKTPDVCPPKNFDGLAHKLFRNTGQGKFSDVSQESGLRPGGPNQSKGLGVVIVDVDGDGKPDIYVANDTVDNFLYLNVSKPGAIRLDERGLVSAVARDDRGNPNGSMGVAAGDPLRSGKPALWVTNYENELHMLYRNYSTPGRPVFNPYSIAAGIGAIGQKFVGWGTGFLDVDLDGWEDLFVANGHAIRHPAGKSANRWQHPVLLLNKNGQKFRDASQQIGDYSAAPRLGRGVAFGDLDNDGHTDLVISHLNEPVALLRGVGAQGNHWLGLQLEAQGHACSVGAKAVWEANGQRQTRFVMGGGSYASSSDRRLLFGLGQEVSGLLTVTWPNGTVQKFANLMADRYYRIAEGSPQAEIGTGPRK